MFLYTQIYNHFQVYKERCKLTLKKDKQVVKSLVFHSDFKKIGTLPIFAQFQNVLEIKEKIVIDINTLEPGTVFLPKSLVQVTLPHSNPGEAPEWTRHNGSLTLTINPSPKGYPYGSIPRLILFWITTEVLKKKNRTIHLGDNLSQFMKDIGLNPKAGRGRRGSTQALKNQMERLFRSKISLIDTKEGKTPLKEATICSKNDLWWNFKSPHERPLFGSWIELSEEFYAAILAFPVPLDKRIIKVLKRSPLSLDLYSWATYTTYVAYKTQKPRVVAWKLLHKQFGSECKDLKNFKRKSWDIFLKIKHFYPDLQMEKVRGSLKISPSQPSVIQKTVR